MRRFAFVRHTITLLALAATGAFAQTTHYSVHAGRFSMLGVDEAEMARMQQMMGGAMPQQSGPAGAFSFGKSYSITGPGMEERSGSRANRASRNVNNAPSASSASDPSGQSGQQSGQESGGVTGAVIKGAGEALKGIFGR